jgi:D-alanyl-D-alanine carboxypeptidase/D-alanyl-D-alanine-endopeptidase (penicillin-binding protein 4)
MDQQTTGRHPLSRRAALRVGATAAVATAVSAAAVSPRRNALAQNPLPARALAIMADPKYHIARWFLSFADRASGEVLYALNGDDLMVPASITKLWATAAALDAYGADYHFETPVYKRGAVGADGTLDGDLILVASGDLTMGGRDTPDGRIAFTSIDHAEANILPGVSLTPQDPLAGLDDLAGQVAAAGVRRVRGDVLVDARLFEQMPKDDYILTPIMINDNLIDLTVAPGAVDQPATAEWRPQTAAYSVQSQVRTVAASGAPEVTVTLPRPGVIVLEGTIPADGGALLRTAQVADPPAFARTLLIEALGRAGVTVDAAPTGPNAAAQLPAGGSYAAPDRVALHRSLPFSENIKLINKVSMNVQADTLICLLAVISGRRTFNEGMTRLVPFIQKAGIESESLSLGDGRGTASTDLFSPRTVTRLLSYMATRPDFPAYDSSLPVFAEVGSEAQTVPPTSPLAGKTRAKSGTLLGTDWMHESLIVMTRGNAGYMTAKSGREIAFGLCVMYVPVKAIDDVFAIIADVGAVVEAIYEVT